MESNTFPTPMRRFEVSGILGTIWRSLYQAVHSTADIVRGTEGGILFDCERPGSVEDLADVLRYLPEVPLSVIFYLYSTMGAHAAQWLEALYVAHEVNSSNQRSWLTKPSTPAGSGLYDKELLESTWLVSRRGGQAPRAITRSDGEQYKLIDVPSSAVFPFICSLTEIGKRSLLVQEAYLSSERQENLNLFDSYLEQSLSLAASLLAKRVAKTIADSGTVDISERFFFRQLLQLSDTYFLRQMERQREKREKEGIRDQRRCSFEPAKIMAAIT
ncbi:hypothetical protein KIN20_006067 [Parelaphostrongylus tenuis]|uniref:Uncharacterized protein n=1 Tax=Parelaphostrongylus tenuis TaxID=148309 RepID=A0AAD5QI13_PARTN|nr:hypothetical protein KIN20_006067 [Parelaphostrongylus tenuis]